jgi:tetratricopeptide (TPR) repeat protein
MPGLLNHAARRRICWIALIAAGIVLPGGLLRARQAAKPSGSQETRAEKPADAARLNNLGVAYLNQQRFAEAQRLFEQALAADPGLSVARMNLGIALHSEQKFEAAVAALKEATAKLPSDPRAWFNLGLLYKDENEIEKSLSAFRRVTEITEDADACYFVGFLLAQQQKDAEAVAAFERALRLDPLHASSEFGIARAYQRMGKTEEAREHLARFQKITAERLGAPLGAGYGDQGRLSVAELVRSPTLVPAAIPVRYLAESIAEAAGGAKAAAGPSTGACIFDYDNDGRPDLFLVSALPGGSSRLLRNLGKGHFQDVTAAAMLNLPGSGLGCAVGDFDNDGHPDLAVCLADGVRLLRNEGHGTFADVTEKSGIRREPGCVSLTFVDYDHDGDLDLYVVNGAGGSQTTAAAHNVLWRNNANGTFTDVSAETGLDLAATGGGLVTSDFNNDRAIDFIFAGTTAGAAIYLNPREGKFTPLAAVDFEKEKLPPAVGVVAFDFDKDGWMDLAFTHAGPPGISLWRNVEGKRLERVPLPDFHWERGWGLAALDYDNDGWLDLVAAGESSAGGELRLLRNLGPGGWADVTRDAHLDAVRLGRPRAVSVADLASNGSADLVVTQLDGPPLLVRNQGGNAHNWVQIDLKALADNRSAIGTKVEMYAGPLYQKWEIQGASGYLSQSATPLLAGLGNEREADVLRLLWPTGIPQDEVKLAARRTQTVGELDRRGSSCPVLFAWNGREYAFIADMIGSGVVGHWVGPGERDVADSDEYVKVSGSVVRAREGMLSFRFLEPMEETVYLDQVRLLAVDHPGDVEVFPNERFVSAPPFPEFRVIASRGARPPAGAWDDAGRDVLPLLTKGDRHYVTGFRSLPFAGFAELHRLELDLGPWNPQAPLRLLLHGYIDYFMATSMYAADQAGVKVIAPYLEALDPATGAWKRAVDDLGFPAGSPRMMVADLTGKLPTGTRRVRIVTNLKIYWDQVLIDATPEGQPIHTSEIPLATASLDFLGYPREVRGRPSSDISYSYSARSQTGPYAHAAGNYTRYGDVKELLSAVDDRFVIFGSGEGVRLEFDARNLPALPAGWRRDYFFYADGFEKDLDFYAANAFTVEPLPHHTLVPYPYPEGEQYPEDPEHLVYQILYNTRARSGRLPANLRYEFAPQY